MTNVESGGSTPRDRGRGSKVALVTFGGAWIVSLGVVLGVLASWSLVSRPAAANGDALHYAAMGVGFISIAMIGMLAGNAILAARQER